MKQLYLLAQLLLKHLEFLCDDPASTSWGMWHFGMLTPSPSSQPPRCLALLFQNWLVK